MHRELLNLISFTAHEPERLLQAAQALADANLRELDRLGHILRGRELRRSLRGELGGERDSAGALRVGFAHIMQQLQGSYDPELGAVTTPQKGRARHTLFLLRLENEALNKTAAASLASVTKARDGHRFMDPSMRAVVVGALSRVDGRLGLLVRFCEEVQRLGTTGTPASETDDHDPDDL